MRLEADVLSRKADDSNQTSSRRAADQRGHGNVRAVASEESFDKENSCPIYQVHHVGNAVQVLHVELTSCSDVCGQTARTVRTDNGHATARRQLFVKDVSELSEFGEDTNFKVN